MEANHKVFRTCTGAGVLVAVWMIASMCGAMAQQGTPSMSGTLLIQWVDGRRFIYVPDPQDGLRFRGRNGREIIPKRMYTDGGSIPRLFWSVKGFSPWGYGPAYVLHDWLFHQHRCGQDQPPNDYSLAQANQVLDDAIEILMTTQTVEGNEQTRRLIKWAVDNFAQSAWAEVCDPLPPEPLPGALEKWPPVVTIERLSFH